MLPENTYSTIPLAGLYLPPDDLVITPLVDYEDGGVGIQDASQGLMGYTWRCWLDNQLDIKLQRVGLPAITLFQQTDVTELALAFDQNMRWAVAYIHEGILKLRWYDTTASGYVTTVFAASKNPKLALDDKRVRQSSNSDIIMAYIRDNNLCYRQQRERFTVERILRANMFPNTKLKNIGMSRNLRLQFELV